MESILQGAIAGLIAALAATAIIGIAKYIRHWWAKRKDVQHIRNLLIQGRKRVMSAEDTFNKNMNTTLPADTLRAAQYNNMTRQVGVALEKWAVNLSHHERKDIYDALDWYNTDGLDLIKKGGKTEFVQLPEGKWHTTSMPKEAAQRKFEKLQCIKWLKLRDD